MFLSKMNTVLLKTELESQRINQRSIDEEVEKL